MFKKNLDLMYMYSEVNCLQLIYLSSISCIRKLHVFVYLTSIFQILFTIAVRERDSQFI